MDSKVVAKMSCDRGSIVRQERVLDRWEDGIRI